MNTPTCSKTNTFIRSIIIIFILLIAGRLSYAQVCSGSIGDPVVNITFGNGIGDGPPLDPGITTLNYTTDCPQDGYYRVVNQMTTCFTDNWHTILHDHTGDANGRFMVLNATIAPSDFYVKRIDGLCGGTTYQFAAWVLNMVTTSGNDPNIVFSIEKTDGTVLNSVTTGNIPKTAAATWRQYPFYFTIPSGVTSVVIRMRNTAPGGLGNDLALDDITFRPAGPAINVGIQGRAGTTATVCESGSNALTLFANAGACYLKTAYQWQQSKDNGTTWANVSGANGTTYQLPVLTAGTYLYRTVVSEDGNIDLTSCRVISDPLTINVSATPASSVAITASANNTCLAGTSITFTATPSGGGATPVYQWMVNGVNAGTNSATFTSSTLNDNDVVTCRLTSSAACAVPVLSNQVVMKSAIPPSSVTITASDNNTCLAGTSITFTATPSGGGATPAYQWMVNGVNAGTNSPTFTRSNLNDNDVITCRLTSSAACAAPVLSNQIVMKSAIPPSSVTIAASDNNTCLAGTSIAFTATPSGGGATPAYQWMVNGVNAGTNSPTFTRSNLNDNDVVTCRLTSSAACAVPVLSNQIVMKSAIPPSSVTIAASTNNICPATTVTFTATISGGGSTPVYQWMVNGVNAGTNSPTFTKTDLNNNDVVKCRLTSNLPCAVPVLSNEITIKVISPITSVAINVSGTTSICKGTPATFTANAANATIDAIYEWQVNGQDAGTNSPTFTSSTLNNNDVVTCIATNPAAGCAVAPKISSNPLKMTVENIPVITLGHTTYTIYNDESITFDAAVTGSNLTYVWTPSTGLDRTDIADPVASPKQTIQYTLTVSSPLACTATVQILVNVLKRDIVPPNSFTPNGDGINDVWNISGLSEYTKCSVDVYNRYGTPVYHSIGYNVPWKGTDNGKPVPLGVYYYVIDLKNGTKIYTGHITIL